MSASPRCPTCGYRALRYRKRAAQYVCRKCASVVDAGQLASGEHAKATRPKAARKAHGISPGPTAKARVGARRKFPLEVARAFTELDDASRRVEAAAQQVYERNDPLGCLPALLALLSAPVVAVAVGSALRWYWTGVAAISAAVATFLLLTFMRFRGWIREHPLLFEWFERNHSTKPTERAERIELSIAVVLHYLGDDESRALLEPLQDAELHAVEIMERFDLLEKKGEPGSPTSGHA
jgi:transcription initiation factor TFIIIB Brf1 subunit/transcription initiation factor TFIIB